jgi:alpha-D-ribose 1-methylphosphonate 5-triphosphate synthase subunit PhnG
MEICALSDPDSLERIIQLFSPFPEPLMIRAPEAGLIMARGRICGEGGLFNLGEILVSRCVLSIAGLTGVGYSLSSDLKNSERIAILDALARNPDYEEAVERELKALIKEREDMILSEEKEIKTTKVEFFTMVRGDNDADLRP